MRIVEQEWLRTDLIAQTLEELGNDVEISLRVPSCLERFALLRRLVEHRTAADAVRILNSRNAALRPHCLVAERQIALDGFQCFFNGIAVRMAVDHHPIA